MPLVEPDGTPTIVSSPYPTPLRLVLAAYRLGRLAPRSGLRGRLLRTRPETRSLQQAWASGAVLSVPTSRFKAVGGFDERYFLYFEDVDLCARLAARFPTMTVRIPALPAGVHGVGGSAAEGPARTRAAAERARSALRYATDRVGDAAPRRRWAWKLAAAAAGRNAAAVAQPPAGPPEVVVVRFGRRRSMGEERRVASWMLLAEEAGIPTTQVDLLAECRSFLPHPEQLLRVISGAAVPESLLWSPRKLRRRIPGGAHAVIFVTSRAFLMDEGATGARIFDYVDRLAVSYEARAAIADNLPARVAYRLLGRAHARVERRAAPPGARRVAAGAEDAAALSAEFVPVLAPPVEPVEAERDVDVLFLGTLDYPPNLAAVRELARHWPAVLAARPGTSGLVAGTRPTPEVIALAADLGWELRPDFPDAAAVYARARVAVAPLRHCAGIQTKVIDAASHGVAQVVYREALAGLPPGFRAVVADESTFADSIVDLLRREELRDELAAAGRWWAIEHLNAPVWAPWLDAAVRAGAGAAPRAVRPRGRPVVTPPSCSPPCPTP